MKKSRTTTITLELTQAEYDHVWDLLYILQDGPLTVTQASYLSDTDIAFAKAFVSDVRFTE